MELATLAEFPVVVIRGAGDLASGVAMRLYRSGFPVIMTELETPLLVRRAVCFGSAMYDGVAVVEGVTARRIEATSSLWLAVRTEDIPVVLDAANGWRNLLPRVVIDARMAKRNIDTAIEDAELVIALGPGFIAGEDCHAVVETNRGHYLGRVIWQGAAEPNTGVPGTVKGWGVSRVLRAPAEGYTTPHIDIGNHVQEGDLIATVGETPLYAPFDGRLRGLIHPTAWVTAGMKIGDLDPRGVYEHCFMVSDKALAVGGGVLTAILQHGVHPMHPDELVGRQPHAAD